MDYRITHRTRYRYDEPVSLSYNLLLLSPRNTLFQSCSNFQVRISPQASLLEERVDRFGNAGHYFEIHKPHKILTITATSDVTTRQSPLIQPENSLPWDVAIQRIREDRDSDARLDRLFLLDSPMIKHTRSIEAFARESFPPGRPIVAAALDLTARINREFSYTPGSTNITTPLTEVMSTRQGVCQDFAHLQIACLRALGLPARYVSGYLETQPPPGKARLVGVDASHAWLAIKIPDLGWIPLDPTNNMIAGERHIMVGWGRDYSDVAPISGVIIGGSQHQLEVSVDVRPIEKNQLSGNSQHTSQPEFRDYQPI
ncbi:MAG: transglutaminase family protein [Magnetococcales bacterium]|nr:transglutaminase family protein [Magnetococcales bacterium]